MKEEKRAHKFDNEVANVDVHVIDYTADEILALGAEHLAIAIDGKIMATINVTSLRNEALKSK